MTDITCGQGNERWLEQLDTKFRDEFAKTTKQPWVTLNKGDLSGWVRSAGGDGYTAGNVTYVQVHAAGYVSLTGSGLFPCVLIFPIPDIWCRSTSPMLPSYVALTTASLLTSDFVVL